MAIETYDAFERLPLLESDLRFQAALVRSPVMAWGHPDDTLKACGSLGALSELTRVRSRHQPPGYTTAFTDRALAAMDGGQGNLNDAGYPLAERLPARVGTPVWVPAGIVLERPISSAGLKRSAVQLLAFGRGTLDSSDEVGDPVPRTAFTCEATHPGGAYAGQSPATVLREALPGFIQPPLGPQRTPHPRVDAVVLPATTDAGYLWVQDRQLFTACRLPGPDRAADVFMRVGWLQLRAVDADGSPLLRPRADTPSNLPDPLPPGAMTCEQLVAQLEAGALPTEEPDDGLPAPDFDPTAAPPP